MSIKGQGYYLTLAKGYLDLKIKSCFSQKLLCHLEPNFIWKLMGEWEWKLYKWVSHTTKVAAKPIMVKTLNIFFSRTNRLMT